MAFQPVAKKFQYETMPSASSLTGQIIQYTGSTTSTYTKGYFYLSDGSTWSHVHVQEESQNLWYECSGANALFPSCGYTAIGNISNIYGAINGNLSLSVNEGKTISITACQGNVAVTANSFTLNGNEVGESVWMLCSGNIIPVSGQTTVLGGINSIVSSNLSLTGSSTVSLESNGGVNIIANSGGGSGSVNITACHLYLNGSEITAGGGSGLWEECSGVLRPACSGISSIQGISSISESSTSLQLSAGCNVNIRGCSSVGIYGSCQININATCCATTGVVNITASHLYLNGSEITPGGGSGYWHCSGTGATLSPVSGYCKIEGVNSIKNTYQLELASCSDDISLNAANGTKDVNITACHLYLNGEDVVAGAKGAPWIYIAHLTDSSGTIYNSAVVPMVKHSNGDCWAIGKTSPDDCIAIGSFTASSSAGYIMIGGCTNKIRSCGCTLLRWACKGQWESCAEKYMRVWNAKEQTYKSISTAEVTIANLH